MELDQFRDVDLVIDYANYSFIEKQFVSQGDYKGRTLTVQVTNDGVVGEVPGLMLNLNWHNEANGLTDLSAFSVLDKANSIYRIEYPQHMMTPGRVVASIQVIQDGKVTNLKQFELTVQKLAGHPVGIVEKAEFSALVAVLADSNKFRADISTLDQAKVDKGGNEQITMPMLSQAVKEAMTGGSVAVVGDESVNTTNIVKKAVTPERTSFLQKISFLNSDFNDYYGVFTGTNPILVESVNKTNACIYLDVSDLKEVKIVTKEIPKFLYLGSTVEEPITGSTISDVVVIADGTSVYDDSKEYIYNMPENHKYLIIRCWNTADNVSFEQVKGYFKIEDNSSPGYTSKVKDDVLIEVGDKNIKEGAIDISKINGLEDTLSEVLSKSDFNEFHRKYITIANTLGFDRDDYIQMKVNFAKGECKSPKCLRVFKNGVELPFQFDGVEEENFTRYSKRTYYPEGSVKAGVLWVKDSVKSKEANLYEIRVYSNDQTYDFQNQISKEGGGDSFEIRENSNIYQFETSTFNLQRINGKVFTDDSRAKINGSTVRLKTFDSKSVSVSGTGVVFTDISRLVQFGEALLCLQNYRIFVGGRIEVTLKSLVLRDTVAGYIESIYSGFNTIGGEVVASESGEYYYSMKNDAATYGISPIYTNGNVQRDSTTLPVYPTKIYTSFRSDQNTLLVGWDYFGLQTYPISRGTFFSSKYIVDLDASVNTKTEQYFPLVGYATDTTINATKKEIDRLVSNHVDHLKDYALSKANLDYYNLSYPYIKYYEYKFNQIGTIDNVVSAFDQTFDVKFSGETPETFLLDYQNGLGIHISGRFIQIAFMIYKELHILNDDRAERFRSICINYGKFISNIWIEKNDVPMVYPTGTTNNGRATALNCMAQSLSLTNDTIMQNSYDGLSNLISQAVRVNSIVPDGNLSTSRYLHYSAFAMYELAKASSLVATQIPNLSSYTSNIVDTTHPTGQIKDMTYCCSDSRRGLGHSYAYAAATLIMKGEYGEVAFGKAILDWLVNQDLPFGKQLFPLDDYAYNASQKYDGALPFELIALIELLDYLG